MQLIDDEDQYEIISTLNKRLYVFVLLSCLQITDKYTDSYYTLSNISFSLQIVPSVNCRKKM